jgi:hypothetical protein
MIAGIANRGFRTVSHSPDRRASSFDLSASKSFQTSPADAYRASRLFCMQRLTICSRVEGASARIL